MRQKLQEMGVFRASKNISIYISMPNSEIITTDIIHDLLKSGKDGHLDVYISYLHGNKRQKLLHSSLHKKQHGHGQNH